MLSIQATTTQNKLISQIMNELVVKYSNINNSFILNVYECERRSTIQKSLKMYVRRKRYITLTVDRLVWYFYYACGNLYIHH